MSGLPLGRNWIPIKRALTTTIDGYFCPIYNAGTVYGKSIYYGLNALSNNLIMADRKKAEESKWADAEVLPALVNPLQQKRLPMYLLSKKTTLSSVIRRRIFSR